MIITTNIDGNLMNISLGNLSIEQQSGITKSVTSNTAREEMSVEITSFMFTNSEGCSLLAGFHNFEDGTAMFAGISLISGPDKYRRAVEAGRSTVEPWGNDQLSARVRAFKHLSVDRPSLAQISIEEFASLSGEKSIRDFLTNSGASGLGTAGQLIGVTNKSQNQLAITFPRDDLRSLAIMWGITRINAIEKKFGLMNLEPQS